MLSVLISIVLGVAVVRSPGLRASPPVRSRCSASTDFALAVPASSFFCSWSRCGVQHGRS